jgi:hypothetical protein
MNIGQIKRKVAALLKGTTYSSMESFVINGEDVLLMALNNARLFAEQGHDFESTKSLVQLIISSPQGADLDTATLLGTVTPVKVKSVVNTALYNEVDGSLMPIDFRKRDSVMAEIRKNSRTDQTYFWGRYPPDFGIEQQLVQFEGIREVMQYNRTIMLRPMLASGSLTLAIEAYVWQNDYVNDGDTDYFTDHGYNYLIWQAVVEANYLAKEFVFRQEGNLGSPEKMADKYLAALVNLDLFSVDQNVDVTAD